MNKDKITVNDALVSTDVDNLIRIISEKRKIALNELERVSKMDRKSMDKWVRVLEDEGYISIAYGLTGTTIIWLGEAQKNYAADEEIDNVLSAMVTKDIDHQDEVLEAITDSDNARMDPEKRLDNYLKRRNAGTEENGLKSSILSNINSASQKHETKAKPVVYETGEEARTSDADFEKEIHENETFEKNRHVQEKEADDEKDEEPDPITYVDFEPTRVTKPPILSDVSGKPTRDMVNSYMNQINKEKAELERLNAEKDRIYRERYLSLESKVEADIASITERILEKEGRVISLKERVLTLPDKVDEISKVHDSIKKLESDGREVLKAAKNDVEAFTADVERSQKEISIRMGQSKELIANERVRLEKLESLQGSADENIIAVKQSVDSAQAGIDDLGERMKDLLVQLEEATEMKVNVTDMIDKVRSSIDSSEAELDNLEKQIRKISQVEQWAREYMEDYESKVDQISQYVKGSDDELESLRASAETAYLKKYLSELEGMTRFYDSEMGQASAEEKGIEEKIDETKKRLSSLVKESKEMISKLRSDSATLPDFDSARSQVAQKTGRILRMVQEKETERERIVEEFAGAKSGRPRTIVVPVRRKIKATKTVSRKKPVVKRKGNKSKKGRK